MADNKKQKSKIVVVDDEQDMRSFLEILLRRSGYSVMSFPTAKRALLYCRANPFDLVITDLRMPGMDGVELLKELKAIDEEAPVIMITAYASVDTAIDAMKAGAYDYFTKPFNIDEIKINISKALEYRALHIENRRLKQHVKAKSGVESIVSQSPVMADIFRIIKGVAATKASVLITGESGTGKELVARAVHVEGDPLNSRFVAINCGAIPENLMESELFGHMKGSFTGAVADKEGLIEQADGGTLFLDEITEMPLRLQVKLLRFLQERTFRRVGGEEDFSVELRIVAASNKFVDAEVRAGRFREDLFYRLNVIHVELPPLRERRSDIPLLAEHFLGKYSAAHNKSVKTVSKDAMERLMGFHYPGNVRELENIIERAVAFSTTDMLNLDNLPSSLLSNAAGMSFGYDLEVPDNGLDIEKTVEDIEKEIISNALKKAGGVKKKAAELLGLSFRSMRYKISKYEIHED
ncbi:MAG: sigma-54-dependent transcriptional regulator [Thermodesulfobacteriota bacterium]